MVKTANFDRTYSAIKRQLKAMNADDYEVGLFHRDDDRMLPRFWTAQEIVKSISWLKVMNSKGYDIFIRPKGSQGLVFFDDLKYFLIYWTLPQKLLFLRYSISFALGNLTSRSIQKSSRYIS